MGSTTRGRVYTAARDLAWWLRSMSFVDRAGDPAETLFIFGSGRSGTTWIQEILNRHGDHRVLFEPFNPQWVRAVGCLPEFAYLTENACSTEQSRAIDRVMSGQVRGSWVDQMNRPMIARRRMVKDIRAHGLAGLIASRWPTMRMVYIVRHPLAVVSSASALNWSDRLDRRLAQPGLVRDHLGEHLDYLQSLRDPWERSVAAWCVDNLVVMRTVDPTESSSLLRGGDAGAGAGDAGPGELRGTEHR